MAGWVLQTLKSKSLVLMLLLCLLTVHACSAQQDKVFGACLNTTAAKECIYFSWVKPRVKFSRTYCFFLPRASLF